MYRGTVVRILEDKLLAKDRKGRKRKSRVAADAEVTCDGIACHAAELKTGMRIRVTTEVIGESRVAIRIEALDKNEKFERPT
jgi:hypothetical protein